MQIKDIPAYAVEIPMSSDCDIDGCPHLADFKYSNNVTDPDAFQVWNLCWCHARELEARIAQSRESKDDRPSA